MDENMKLWNDVCKTDPSHTKEVALGTFGRRFTSVDAQYQVKNATKQWGRFGDTWGVKEEKYNQIHLGENDSVVNSSNNYHYCLYSAILYYPGGQTEIHSDIEIIHSSGKREGDYNDDWSKKIATDALTKGLSKLGFNSDVFEGRFDDKYYVQEMNIEFGNIKTDKMPQRITPDLATVLHDELKLRGGDIEKLLQSVNKKFGTKYKDLIELWQVHYDYILKQVKGKPLKNS